MSQLRTQLRVLPGLAAVLFALCLAPAFAADEAAASFEKVSGQVTVTSLDGKTRKPVSGDSLRSGDTIVTGTDSDALIKLSDGGRVALRPGTSFQLTEVRYDSKPSDTLFMSLLKGTARFVTGLIGKNNRERVQLKAGAATIGIRGTDFEVAIVPDGSADGRAGIYDHVHEGATHMQLASGPGLDVKESQTGFAPEKPAPGEAPLQLLDKRPAFIKGGGFDTMMLQQINMPIRSIQQMPRLP